MNPNTVILRIVGEQYRRGSIRIYEAASLLRVPVPDSVFELERHGFAHGLAEIGLTESQREAAYQRLRQRRRTRGEPPVVDPAHVERDVIASERLEGVDARAWIRRG